MSHVRNDGPRRRRAEHAPYGVLIVAAASTSTGELGPLLVGGELVALDRVREAALRAEAQLAKKPSGCSQADCHTGICLPAPACPYYQITDAQIHALVGDGTHGKTERIQTFGVRRAGSPSAPVATTPLYRLKTASDRVAEVLAALAEGLDVAAAVRVFGHRPATITIWLTRAGAHSATLHERWFHHLQLPHVQLDEIRTRLRAVYTPSGCGWPLTRSPKSSQSCIWAPAPRPPHMRPCMPSTREQQVALRLLGSKLRRKIFSAAPVQPTTDVVPEKGEVARRCASAQRS